jgi:group I intron endonuclease
MDHVIYKITNTVNGKIYIGQTKKFRGEKKYGIEKRFKSHISASKRNKGCPKLCNSMRKYGSDKFIIEQIDEASVDHIDEKEIHYIKLYNSTNDNIGYNITMGGGGLKSVHPTDETRKKMSNARKENGDVGINQYKKNGIVIGYICSRVENKIQHKKLFSDQKRTLEEKYQLALNYMEAIKNNTTDNHKKYNRTEDLPRNISCVYDKKDKEKIIGYHVRVERNGKETHKMFKSVKKDPTELLKSAIDYKEDILKDIK